ncbi:MAG TPA: PEP-CTERM sorting domain-containing protein [Phycisphaerae bacterium]|nr:PEP-CTERM sorting domain-containing protein [Phycisphaerae bacterium]
MRCFKLLLMGGIVLALSGQVWGLTLLHPYNGPMTMQLANWDEGTLYLNLNDGEYTGAYLHTLQTTDPGNLTTPWRILPISGDGSDTWGIVRINNIYSTEAVPQLLFDGLAGPTSLTGIFYGETDTFMKQATDINGNTVQNIHGTGMNLAIYEQPRVGSLFNPVLNGPSTGSGGTATPPMYAGVTDGALVWTMASAPGNNAAYPTDEFFSTFTFGDIYNSSQGKVLFDMATIPFGGGFITGPQNWQLDTDTFATSINTTVDVTNTFTASADPGQYPDIGSWLVRSSDPFNTNIVPEPVTMAGLLLGIGCLGRYIRRRR